MDARGARVRERQGRAGDVHEVGREVEVDDARRARGRGALRLARRGVSRGDWREGAHSARRRARVERLGDDDADERAAAFVARRGAEMAHRSRRGCEHAKRTPDSEKETRASSSLTSTADDPSSLAGDSHLTSAEETNAASRGGGETPKRHAGPAPSRSAACSLATCTTVPPEEGPDAGESERTSAPTTNSKSAESSKNARPSPTRTSSDVHPAAALGASHVTVDQPTHVRERTRWWAEATRPPTSANDSARGAHTSATPSDAAADARDDDVAETTLRPPRRRILGPRR